MDAEQHSKTKIVTIFIRIFFIYFKHVYIRMSFIGGSGCTHFIHLFPGQCFAVTTSKRKIQLLLLPHFQLKKTTSKLFSISQFIFKRQILVLGLVFHGYGWLYIRKENYIFTLKWTPSDCCKSNECMYVFTFAAIYVYKRIFICLCMYTSI